MVSCCEDDASLVSPIGTLYVERYSDVNQVVGLGRAGEDIQVVTVREGCFKGRSNSGVRTADRP